MVVRVLAAARSKEKGFYEYLWELKQARERFGPQAADFELALDLAFNAALAKKHEKDNKRR